MKVFFGSIGKPAGTWYKEEEEKKNNMRNKKYQCLSV